MKSLGFSLHFQYNFWVILLFNKRLCLQFCRISLWFLYVECVYREELVRESIQQGTKLVQAIADSLFSLTSTEDRDGPIVKLPPPTTRLPREKPVCSSFLLSTVIVMLALKTANMFLCMHTDFLLYAYTKNSNSKCPRGFTKLVTD